MGINILEIKTVLRSILVSSSVVINVSQLDRDFREQMGFKIPYRELGHDSLLKFLNSIPDVLVVQGDTLYSDVFLVESEKSAHVSELVLKQKLAAKPGSFFPKGRGAGRRSPRIRRNKKHFYVPAYPPQKKEPPNPPQKKESVNPPQKKESPNPTQKKESVNPPQKKESANLPQKKESANLPQKKESANLPQKKESSNEICRKSPIESSSQKVSSEANRSKIICTNDITKNQCGLINNLPEKNSISLELGINKQRLISENKDLKNTITNLDKEHNLSSESTKLLRRIDYKNSTPNQKSTLQIDDLINESDLGQLDIWKESAIQKQTPTWMGGPSRIFSNSNTRNEYFSEVVVFKSSFHTTPLNMPKTNSGSSTQRSISVKCKTGTNYFQNRNIKNRSDNNIRKKENIIPSIIQDNLRRLISGYPEGLWCAELPTSYKKFTGKDLDFENLGYRCLIHLCLDLENIFQCVKESSCDYVLYDASKPLPEIRVSPDQSIQNNSFEVGLVEESMPAIPEISWEGYEYFLPKDAVRLGQKVERIQAAEVFQVGTSVNVVVAEIYDISKFWIYLDDFKLDGVMEDMQRFYTDNNKYLIPKSLLAKDLFCVVLFQSKFHRAVVLNVMADEDYIKVFYFDYGTLGTVLKSEVWFLSKQFSELPCQAIRARLADIYPPYEGVTWSPFANHDFSKLTCMKKLTADILRTDKHKNVADIKLKNRNGDYISDILVNKKYASFISKTPKKRTDDTNIESKVKFIHLFPTFEEIENWIVPSMEEGSDFLETTVTADFLYSQYFSRRVNKDLVDSVEEKMKTLSKKTKALIRHIKPEELTYSHSIEEMNAIAYGNLYVPSIKQAESGSDFEEKRLEEVETKTDSKNNSWVDIEDDETLARILRQTRMSKIYSLDGEEFQDNRIDLKNKANRDPSRFDSSGSSMKAKSPLLQKFSKPSKPSIYLELEKYLSDSSKETNKQSTPNLIDLDECLAPFTPSTNLLLSSEFEQSMLDLAKSRKKCQNCLLTDNTISDMENSVMVNPLDLPIPNLVSNQGVTTDLIQFDEEDTSDFESKNLIPSIITPIGTTDLSDADNEDSDGKQEVLKFVKNSFNLDGFSQNLKVESTSIKASVQSEHSRVSNGFDDGKFFDVISDEACDTTNNTELASPIVQIKNNCVISNSQTLDSSNLVDLDINESEKDEANDRMITDKKDALSNIDVMNCNSKTNLTFVESNLSSNEQRCLSNASNKTTLSSNSIVTIKSLTSYVSNNTTLSSNSIVSIDSVEFEDYEILEAPTISNIAITTDKTAQQVDGDQPQGNANKPSWQNESSPLIASDEVVDEYSTSSADSDLIISTENNKYLKEDVMHESSSSTNLYYSCESKESSVANSICEDSLDISIFDVYDDDDFDSSTPIPTKNFTIKDRSFLEEFDIIEESPTVITEEGNRNDCVETQTSQQEVDDCNQSKSVVQQESSDTKLANASYPSYKTVNKSQLNLTKGNKEPSVPVPSAPSINLPEVPSSSNIPNVQVPVMHPPYPYPSNYMHRPRMLMPPPGFSSMHQLGFPSRAPPGFAPMGPLAFTTVIVPNSIQHPNGFVGPTAMQGISPQQQEIVNEVAQFYRTQPIVVLNYNFTHPQVNRNDK